MIGVLAARNKLKVKNARQPVDRKDIEMLRSRTEQTKRHLNITLMTTMIKLPRFLQLHKKKDKNIFRKNHVCTTYCSNILYSATNWVSGLPVQNNKHLQ